MMADTSRKRKQPSDTGPNAKRVRFPQRPQHHINVQPTKAAYPNGEVNVKNFLKSHENEIKSLENAMRAAKKGLSRRAFQEVPREMRRRTASHNPQRVPKRLRVRSKQEAREDNTPTSRGKSGSGVGKGAKAHLRKEGREESRKKNRRKAKDSKDDEGKMDVDAEAAVGESAKKASTMKTNPRPKPKTRFPALATPATPPSRFRRRQKDKTWLPTHLWHTKRARMTDPKDPLWRFAIPLQPVSKAYRLTHRAASQRGAVAWDMSYMATIGLEGPEASVVGMLKGLHFGGTGADDPWRGTGRAKKWRNGTRAWEGWIYERETRPLKKIAPVSVLWCVQDAVSKKRKVFVRVHPGAFLHLWNEAIRISKVQKPGVTVEDLRYEIGSIEILGPAAAETLSSILSPTHSTDALPNSPHSTWPLLAPVTDVEALPAGAVIAFDVADPRFRDPPNQARLQRDEQSMGTLVETLAEWPLDDSQEPSSLFDRTVRLSAQRSMPSEKSINRRKSMCTLGEYPEARSTDPQIPAFVYVSRQRRCWTVLLPWKCVQPVWRGIMRYPVSTGGNPRFGGLKERRQVDFERSVPHFPFDHPGTDAGWAWELKQRQVRKHEWTKRPKGKRIEWSTIILGNDRKGELGDPWACDWERLLPQPVAGDAANVSSPLLQLSTNQTVDVLAGRSSDSEVADNPCVFTAKITMVQRGVPTDCARVYRLPSSNEELRGKWLSLVPKPGTKQQSIKRHYGYRSDVPEHVQRRELARNILEPPAANVGPPKAGEEHYPPVPDEEDLLGFVTTGNFNLAEGMPTAIANMALHRVLNGVPGGRALLAEERLCIVRPSDSKTTPAMSEDRPADDHGDEGVKAAIALTSDALVDLTGAILEDCLETIISRTIVACHRSEKVLRMQSAATQAESLALAHLEPQSQKANTNGATSSSIPVAETPAAKYENGRVFLKGNPLKTTPEIICPHCKLPRLMHPIMGKGMQNPDLTKEYCMLYPWVQRSGHDVYGNPFPTDMAKSKKERELIKQQQKNEEKESVGTPGSQDTDMVGGTREIKLNTGGKPASYIPWHTCPNCKRSLLITRFSQHLEKCLGISGRQSSRNAMAKLVGQNGSGSGLGNTPLGSRMGTPQPGSQDGLSSAPVRPKNGKGPSPVKKMTQDDDADELGQDDTPERKKIKKKSSYVKKADREKLGSSGSLKVKLKSGRPDIDRRASEMSERSEGKRDREDGDDGEERKKKKIKLSISKTENGRTSASAEPASAVD
ncbi:ribonucleases P/MRP protein subunit POP1-domain-containing protein [Paraphoma chrysanthemicola]|uniref:SAGA-associated factor 11 n=1 Tax=Paraphoma chrysanthemicola TaxID=798071 RepID=A0A8K0RAU8_9PLEO|nr:ribonucleases P/MRP protein subunit POP1-domain-containing protein [Paraphoma chrysanthemicola]